jgi:hypothetical protein
VRGTSVAGTLAFMVWAKAVRRPIDSLAILTAAAASLTIVINALFLQNGPHGAPFSIDPAPPLAAVSETPSKVTAPPLAQTHTVEVTRTTPAVPGRHGDPIAQLIGQSSQILAVQRALSDYGYGQLKQTGVLDPPTIAAIEDFEREHSLPVTGKISDGLLSSLAEMIGRPLR